MFHLNTSMQNSYQTNHPRSYTYSLVPVDLYTNDHIASNLSMALSVLGHLRRGSMYLTLAKKNIKIKETK